MAGLDFLPLASLGTQPAAEALLTRALEHPGPDAWLFEGPSGVGKRTYARAFVRELLCPASHPPEVPCASCRHVAAGSHPDLLWALPPGGMEGTVELAREVQAKVSRAPLAGAFVAVVLPEADRLNEHAQNLLLKTLEEPPARAVLVLAAVRPDALQPTVRSRLRSVRFFAVPRERLAEGLIRHHGIPPQEARAAAADADGSFIRALLSRDSAWRKFRAAVEEGFDACLADPEGSGWLDLAGILEKAEPPLPGEEEAEGAAKRRLLYAEAFRIYMGLWSRRLLGEVPLPRGVEASEAAGVLGSLQRHADLLDTHLNPRLVLDRFLLEARKARRGAGWPAPDERPPIPV